MNGTVAEGDSSKELISIAEAGGIEGRCWSQTSGRKHMRAEERNRARSTWYNASKNRRLILSR